MIEPITYFPLLLQGTDEWLEARRGMMTASEMHLIVTPTLKMASNDKERAHLYELLAQRISGFVEPHYISNDMLRGHDDEVSARNVYQQHFAPVHDMGFIVNHRHGVSIGYSPDGLVGDDGLIECKSRRQKFQVQTIIECVESQTIPADFVLQVQTGLLVSERAWCDLLSYCGGLPMTPIRVYPDPVVREAIIAATQAFEARLKEKMAAYESAISSGAKFIPTERTIEQEITL